MTSEVLDGIEVKKHAVLPVYLVVDVSYSMAGEPLERATAAVRDIISEIGAIPSLADAAYLSLVTFSELAATEIPLSNASRVNDVPALVPRSSTSYAEALRHLQSEIPADIQNLKANGNRVFRPVIFFLTDGEPTDDERDVDAALQQFRACQPVPNLIPIGIGDLVRDEVLAKVRTGKVPAFKATGDVAAAMREIAPALVSSVVSSAQSSMTGSPMLDTSPLAESENIHQIPMDEV